jgi:DNA-binding MarR family transcriptional regulator
MDAISTDAAADLSYSDLPPVLLVASSDRAMARAERSVIAAGFRVGARMPIAPAAQRIDQQAMATGVWIELDSDCGEPMDELLRKVSGDVGHGRYSAVVSATSDLLDPLVALLDSGDVEVIIDAGEAERVAALAVASVRRAKPLVVSDIASDNNAERLRQLSEEVSRIASTLARLSTGPGAPVRAVEAVPAGDVPPLSADIVRSVIRARRLRARYFREDLFADPAWDMLLDLLQAEIAQLRVPVSSLCIAASVPATTALRWLKAMVSQGIFIRHADPHDGRRVFVELAPEASQALRRYFAEVGQVAVI